MKDNNFKSDGNNKKKITFLAIAVMILMIATTGSTYAYFALSASNATAVTGTTANVSLSLSVAEQPMGGTKSGSTVSGKFVPQLSSAIGTAIGNNYKCIDENGNTVCKVYKITVTNGSDAGALVNGTIKFTSYNNTQNLRWRRIQSPTTLASAVTGSYLASGVTVAVGTETDLISGGTCVPSGNSTSCTDISLAPSGHEDYYIVVWLFETGDDQTDVDSNKTFLATIKFEGANGQGITSTITS